jgi:hypothetical protein
MKTPPCLLFAALVFWGWQSDFLILGAVLGAGLEVSRVVKFRWELDDTDFNRIWSFCVLLNFGLIVYVFTNNEGEGLGGLRPGHTVAAAANATVLTSIRFLRWLPLTTYAFLLVQVFNVRPTVPLTAISLVLRWRRRHGEKTFAGHFADISYPYFFLCLSTPTPAGKIIFGACCFWRCGRCGASAINASAGASGWSCSWPCWR